MFLKDRQEATRVEEQRARDRELAAFSAARAAAEQQQQAAAAARTVAAAKQAGRCARGLRAGWCSCKRAASGSALTLLLLAACCLQAAGQGAAHRGALQVTGAGAAHSAARSSGSSSSWRRR